MVETFVNKAGERIHVYSLATYDDTGEEDGLEDLKITELIVTPEAVDKHVVPVCGFNLTGRMTDRDYFDERCTKRIFTADSKQKVRN